MRLKLNFSLHKQIVYRTAIRTLAIQRDIMHNKDCCSYIIVVFMDGQNERL